MVSGRSRRGDREAGRPSKSCSRRERRVVKPASWPRYLREKRLKSGTIAYFWEPPSIYVRQGFKGQAEPLGTNFATACERARLLTSYLDDWRIGQGEVHTKEALRAVGTVAWLFDRYLKSAAFEQRVSERSRYE